MRWSSVSCTFMLAVRIAAGQFGLSAPPPDNTVPVADRLAHPTEVGQLNVCLYFDDPNLPGQIPAPAGSPVRLVSVETKRGSGVHEHEFRFPPDPGSIVQILGTNQRPTVQVFSAYSQTTGADHCAHWTVSFPEFSGWYKFNTEHLGGKGGLWVHSIYWLKTPLGNKTSLIPYPYPDPDKYATGVNAPPDYWRDPWHGPLDGKEYTRYLSVESMNRFLSVSKAYHAVAGNVAGDRDKLNILRCSLPEGGAADNGVQVSTPFGVPDAIRQPWNYPTAEGHFFGTECDVLNPIVVGSKSNAELAIQIFQNSGCHIGYSHATAPALANIDWMAQNVWHVDCTREALIALPGGRR